MIKTLERLRIEIQTQQTDSTLFDTLFWILTFIISLQALIGSLCIPTSIFEGCWIALILILTLISAIFSYFHIKVSRPRIQLCHLQYFIIAIIAFAFFARFYNIDSLSIWFDEYHQLKLLRNIEQESLLLSVIAELQLPLYYMVQKSQMVIFGESPLSLKFWSLLSGSLLPLVSWLGLRKLKFQNYLILFAVSYLAFHPLLIFKSLVIRPYSFYTLMVGFFWIYFLLSIKDDRYHFRVAVSLLLCFLTLSFLTAILVVAIMIAIVLLGLSKKKIQLRGRDYRGILWGFLAALPLNLYLVHYNIKAHWGGLMPFWGTINKSSLLSFNYPLDFFNIALVTLKLGEFTTQYLLLFFLILLGVTAIIYLKFCKIKINSDADIKALAITSIVIALYPMIFVPIFTTVAIYSHSQIRFAIAGVVLFGLWLSLFMQFALFFINSFKNKLLAYYVKKISLLLLLVAIFSISMRLHTFIFQSPTPYNRPNWKEFYKLIQGYPPSVLRHLPTSFHFFSPGLVGNTYYAAESEHYFALNNIGSTPSPDLSEDIARLKSSDPFKPSFYFILLSPYWSDKHFKFPEINHELFSEEKGYKFLDSEDELHLHIIAFENDENLNERLYPFFEYLFENSNSYLQKKSMLYYLAMYAYYFKDWQRFEAYADKWHKENFEAHWIDFQTP